MFDFTFSVQLTNSALPAIIPTRQPGMLWLFESELNSMQHSFAPGTWRMESGRALLRMKL